MVQSRQCLYRLHRRFPLPLRTDKKERILHAAVYTVYCYEAARDVQEQDFPWDEDGVSALKAWLQEKYEAFCGK